MEKLPIKFFAKRETDGKKVEGGGSSELPKFVLEGEELISRSEYLKYRFETMIDLIEDRFSKSDIPVITAVEIIEQAKAKSHKMKLRKFFETNKRNNIIGLINDNELVVKFDSLEDYKNVISRFDYSEIFEYQISSIENIKLYEPITQIEEIKNDYKLKLFNYNSYIEDRRIYSKLELDLDRINVQFTKTTYTQNSLIYRLLNVDQKDIDKILQLDSCGSIFSITPMPKYEVSLDSSPLRENRVNVEPDSDMQYEVIGVLDSGIEHIDSLKNWIVKDNYSAYPENKKDKSHGTFVAGIVVYGDKLENQVMTETGMFKVLDACVFPDKNKETLTEDQLINNIKEAVEMYHEIVKIWTLSISIVREVKDNKFSDFAAALDYLQDKYNILILKSAGNTENFKYGEENGRIVEGADSVNALTIGSIAHKETSTSLVKTDDISPFSRIGRGPAEIIKPDLVHYGGNIDKVNDEYIGIGVNSFGLKGDLCSAIGTSFSTPRVAGLVADLKNALDEEFDPLLLKALLIHSGNYPLDSTIPIKERIKFFGFGKPKNVKGILYNDNHNSTLILRDELFRSEKIDIFDFPMPDIMINNGYYTGDITVTIVYSPILNINQGSEYSQSDIDIKFGTYDNIKERDITKSNILNKFGRNISVNTLLPSFFSSKKISGNLSDFSLREHTLIKYLDKYYPVKKYSFSLEDAAPNNKAKHLVSNRKWYLYLKGIYRDNAECLSEMAGEELSQKFCLIITISDPTHTKNVYDGVVQKLNEHNFWNTNIKLRADIKIEV